MFCVFLYFTSFGRKSIKFQDYNEVGKLTFEKIQLQINFEFKKRGVGKISYFLKESKMSKSLYFNHNFVLEYQIVMKLVTLES
jgi:hypothetical protein